MIQYDALVISLLESTKSKPAMDKKSREYLAHRDEIIAKSEFKRGDAKKGIKFLNAAKKLKEGKK